MSKLRAIDGRQSSILGLAGNWVDREEEDKLVELAYDSGINFFFFSNFDFSGLIEGLVALVKTHRNEILIGTGTRLRDTAKIRQYIDEVRRRLKTDYIDIFYTETELWDERNPIGEENKAQAILGRGGVIELLNELKTEGTIRYVMASTHSRTFAVDLVRDDRIDILMQRYNMALREIKRKVIPLAMKKQIPILAFTCTYWGNLLKGHKKWRGQLPTAIDCYRFALSQRGIDYAFTAPGKIEHLKQNVELLKNFSPMDNNELKYWRRYGNVFFKDTPPPKYGKDATQPKARCNDA